MSLKFYSTCIFLCFALIAQAQSDYLLEIDGQNMAIEANEEYQVEINGKMVRIKLSQKDTLDFQKELFHFKHSKDYKVSSIDIEYGVTQYMIMTAEGSGFLIQSYDAFNPSLMTAMFLSEITKESLDYGYQMEKEKYSRRLASGQEIEIEKATLTYKDEVNIYEVSAIGGKDNGIIILTMVMSEELNSQGRSIIDMMWDSLAFKGS